MTSFSGPAALDIGTARKRPPDVNNDRSAGDAFDVETPDGRA